MIPSLLQRVASTKRSYQQFITGTSFLSLGLVLFVWQQPFVPVEYITRDPAAIANHPIYYGALSNLGILLWAASTTTCLLGGLVTKMLSDRWTIASFFAAFGGLSAVLCLDDLFMIHEDVFPKKLGLSEDVLFILYAVSLSYMLFHFRKILFKMQPALLGLSLLLFALSTCSDLIPAIAHPPNSNTYAFEDGSKFIAIFVWFSYFLWAAVEQIMLCTGQKTQN